MSRIKVKNLGFELEELSDIDSQVVIGGGWQLDILQVALVTEDYGTISGWGRFSGVDIGKVPDNLQGDGGSVNWKINF